jgi:hypothetical protein
MWLSRLQPTGGVRGPSGNARRRFALFHGSNSQASVSSHNLLSPQDRRSYNRHASASRRHRRALFLLFRKRPSVTAPHAGALPEGSKVKLSVVTGLRLGKTYVLKEGVTYVGRKGPHPIDVDLTDQENPGVAVAVNRFALIWFDRNGLSVADTGRRVTRHNGAVIVPGKRLPIQGEDTLQFGKTVLQVKVILKKRTAAQK